MIPICFVSLSYEVSHEFIISLLYYRLSGILADIKRGWLIGWICVRMADPGGRAI
jgi:hypothetical protein